MPRQTMNSKNRHKAKKRLAKKLSVGEPKKKGVGPFDSDAWEKRRVARASRVERSVSRARARKANV